MPLYTVTFPNSGTKMFHLGGPSSYVINNVAAKNPGEAIKIAAAEGGLVGYETYAEAIEVDEHDDNIYRQYPDYQ